MDSLKSFEGAKLAIDKAFKNGEISGNDAKKILEKSRESYRNGNYNRELEKRGLSK